MPLRVRHSQLVRLLKAFACACVVTPHAARTSVSVRICADPGLPCTVAVSRPHVCVAVLSAAAEGMQAILGDLPVKSRPPDSECASSFRQVSRAGDERRFEMASLDLAQW